MPNFRRFLPRRAPRRALRAACVAAVAALAAACGPDPFAPVASVAVADHNFEIWALTGSPTAFPTALAVPQRLTLRLDAAGSFDLAFDITPGGRLQVLPTSKVVAPTSGQRGIGVIVPTAAFETITEAPRNGWTLDSIVELDVGQTFMVQVSTQFCSFQQQQIVYAKYRVDSIFPAERRARITGRVNPNCGFRSFADGIPEF